MDSATIIIFLIGTFISAAVILIVEDWLRNRRSIVTISQPYSSLPTPRQRPRVRHNLDWALKRQDWVVIDLETTGYTSKSEII